MQTDSRIGTDFAGYRIESLLGRGGMAVVYLASDSRLGRRVALKVLATDLGEDERFRDRFIRESQLAASLDHPNIIPIYEAGEFEGSLFIAMRFVDGIDLKGLIREQGPLPPSRAVAIVSQIAGALDAAQARKLVHRDVKPANVLIAQGSGPDGTEHVYLTDFGLAKTSTSNTGLTQTGQFMGTLDYVAPEQIEGKPIDGRADIYALGCVLYECLTGRPPYDRESSASVMYAHLQEPPPSVTAVRPDAPAGLNVVVATAMAKEPDDRYQTARAMVDAARKALISAPLITASRDATQVAPIVGAVTAASAIPPLAGSPVTAGGALASALSPAQPAMGMEAPTPPPPTARAVSGAAKWREAPILVNTEGTGPHNRRTAYGGPQPAKASRRTAILVGVLVAAGAIGVGGFALALNRTSSLQGTPPINTRTSPSPAPSPGTTGAASTPTPAPTASGPPPLSALTATGFPSGRAAFGLGYDPVTQRLLMEGGATPDGQAFAETWSWDGKTWSKLTTTSPALAFGAMALDPKTNRQVLVGGQSGAPTAWIWDGQNWTSFAAPPIQISGPMFGADPIHKQLVEAGIPAGQAQGQNGSTTSYWNGSAWKKGTLPANYLLSSASGTAWDPISKRLISLQAYDGSSQASATSSTLAWTGATWTRVLATTQPPAGGAVAGTDEARGQIVAVAPSVDNPKLPTTWTWDGNNWNRQVVSEPPLPLGFDVEAMAWDPAVNALILVAVDSGNQASMWVWSGSDTGWVKLPG